MAEPSAKKPLRQKGKPPKAQKRSKTDPDATMTTSNHSFHMEPFYKQHTAVDDQQGIIVDVDVTTGQLNEGKQLAEQLERLEAHTGCKPDTATADKGYAHGANYEHLEQRQIEGIIPPQTSKSKSNCIPACRFKYDAKHRIITCPAKRRLTYRQTTKKGDVYRARAKDCKACRLRRRCFSASAKVRTILIGPGYESLLRARRVHARREVRRRILYTRHRWRVEGVHGEAKVQYGLGRAVRRGLWNVAIQAYLTAIVMNLKRLAAVCQTIRQFVSVDWRKSGFGNGWNVAEMKIWIRIEKMWMSQTA